jgi:hypothetical protein
LRNTLCCLLACCCCCLPPCLLFPSTCPWRPQQTVRSVLREAYGRKEAVTDELVQKILGPGLLPGAVDVFLDFIRWERGAGERERVCVCGGGGEGEEERREKERGHASKGACPAQPPKPPAPHLSAPLPLFEFEFKATLAALCPRSCSKSARCRCRSCGGRRTLGRMPRRARSSLGTTLASRSSSCCRVGVDGLKCEEEQKRSGR